MSGGIAAKAGAAPGSERPAETVADSGMRSAFTHAALSERLYQRYTEAQLELLLGFVREGREFNERHAAEVEQQNRARRDLPAPEGPANTPDTAPRGHGQR